MLWDGVIYYLSNEAVAATLRALRKPGVSLSFDMFSKDFSVFARTMSRYVRFIDEPTLFGIDFDGVRDWASKHGWDVTDALCGPKEINTRFFADADKV